jgi:murein L,D-transpeptidase YafK
MTSTKLISALALAELVLLAGTEPGLLRHGAVEAERGWTRTEAERRLREAALSAGAPWPIRDSRVVVRKAERTLELWSDDKLLRTYPIALGNEPERDKEREGDHRTPEGEFYVCTRNERSRFHLFLGVSYPAKEDAERGLESRLIGRREY